MRRDIIALVGQESAARAPDILRSKSEMPGGYIGPDVFVPARAG